MLEKLHLLKYLKSFSDTRIRIRHPALKNKETSLIAKQRISLIKGITEVECNTISGSILILYNSNQLSKNELIELGEKWANYLDACENGIDVEIP